VSGVAATFLPVGRQVGCGIPHSQQHLVPID